MKIPSCPWRVVFLLLITASGILGFSPQAAAEDSAGSPPATRPNALQVDRFGDQFPSGAKLRLGTVRLRQERVTGVAFSPDGKHLVSSGWDDSIRFWDVDSGRLVRRLETDEQDGTFAVAFSPDGNQLASVSERGFVRLWNLQTGKVVSKVLGHVERTFGVRVYGVAFAPDGLTFATAGADQSVRLWDAATGAELLELQSEEGGGDARPVTFSPDGSLLASGTDKGTIQIWNLAEGGEAKIIPKAHERDIVSLVFTNDGKYLISSGTRLERTGERSVRSISEIHLWDVASGEKESGFGAEEELAGNCTLAISRDGRFLVSGHYEKIVIWDVETRKLKRVIRGEKEHYGGRTHGLAISPDGNLLASGMFSPSSNKVFLWNLQTGEPVFPQSDSHTEEVLAINLSPDGSTIATGSADGTVRLWNAETGEHLRLLDKGSGWVRYVEFFPDGQLLALGRETHEQNEPGFQGEVKICRVADGKVIHHLPVPDRVMCGALSPDGERLGVGIGLGRDMFGIEPGASECKILVWNTESGTKLHEFSGHTSRIEQVAFSADAKELWSTSDDKTVRRWDLDGDERPEGWNVTADDARERNAWAVFDPNTSRFAIRGLGRVDQRTPQGQLAVRSIESSEASWERTFDDSWPRVFALSEDGKLLAAYLFPLSGSTRKARIAVMSADDGKETISLDLVDGTVRSLAFSPDGNLLMSGMQAGDTLVWNISTAAEGRGQAGE